MSDPAPTVDPAAESEEPASGKRGCFRSCLNLCLVLGILFLIFLSMLGPIGHSPGRMYENLVTQRTRTIGLMMFSYANDNNGNYPDGKNSTEVFQKLLDGNYGNGPGDFYIPLCGKTKAVPGQKLKPENVCFDVTAGVDSSSPEGLPIVFITGYKVTYTLGASAVPLIKPYPRYGSPSWLEWWTWGDSSWPEPGIAVCYKSNSSKYILLVTPANSEGAVPNFVPSDFDAKGKTYRQLTPDGPLP